MKTFEEKFTAWLDGNLRGEDLRSFENDSMRNEKEEFHKLKNLLRENLKGCEMEHPDFFNSEVMAQIEREQADGSRRVRTWFGVPRFAWAGVFALVTGFALFFTMIPRSQMTDPRSDYVAEVLKAKTADPSIKATVDNQKDITIIKLENLDKAPPEKAKKSDHR
jgi:hypothetical protein